MYRVFLHPNREGNGPSFWGFEETGQSCDIFWGKLEGPFQTRSMKSGYSPAKESEKLGKGYRDVGSMPADQMPTFFNAVPKTRSQREWESLPLGTMESRLVSVLRNVRQVIGLSSVHPDDSRPPDRTPSHRRPIRTKIKAKKLAWMF